MRKSRSHSSRTMSGSSPGRHSLDPREMASSDRDAIAQRAYEMYLAGGCEDGHAFDHWLAAEREVVRPPSRRD